jgi:16S rRNA A1518/A1519 N6-dimethyltransferase RsmA/KsgA/DIM1 with predicted DNA glycosylase/AP lyase activity
MRRVLRSLWSVSAEEADTLLTAAGVDPSARPETLSPERFAALVLARPSSASA